MLKTLTTAAIQTWFRLNRGMTLGVRVLAIDQEQRVCLVRHTYVAGWHLPGGGVEHGESGLEAAIKEAREEAGLIVDPAQLELRSIHTNFAYFKGDHILLYRAHAWTSMPTSRAHEIAEHGFFALSDLPPGTTTGTRNRLAEAAGAPISPIW
jgi:8-oxo-dGTP pyrophosphatase MutT (NUDIX family)